ncbi:MAG: UbiA family prenyltransferase [Anaerolineales bacterium]|jgi:geranylgeranylglycerol-phosphate geranylgeranyltransferase
MTRKKVLGLARLFRFELPFAAGVCVVLGTLLALRQFPDISLLVLSFSSVFFTSAAALILNDYFDVESDKLNAPDRPIPSGLVTKQDVLILAIVVTLLGILASALISIPAMVTVVLVWLVGFLYNWRLKKAGILGNLMVSLSVGMTFIYGGIVVGKSFEPVVWFFALLVALINLGEEIAADAMDVTGDRQAQSRSLAVLLGPEQALKISGVIFLMVVAISFLPVLLGWLGLIYLLPIFLMDLVILFSTKQLLNSKLADRRKYVRWIYLSGLVALIVIIVMLVWL